jgi:TRAP-type C4-dicarboxylate transport system permease small subunit
MRAAFVVSAIHLFVATVILVIILVAGLLFFPAGYWLADQVYDAGIWPVGAALRVMLFLLFLGWVGALLAIVIGTPITLFMGLRGVAELAEDTERDDRSMSPFTGRVSPRGRARRDRVA